VNTPRKNFQILQLSLAFDETSFPSRSESVLQRDEIYREFTRQNYFLFRFIISKNLYAKFRTTIIFNHRKIHSIFILPQLKLKKRPVLQNYCMNRTSVGECNMWNPQKYMSIFDFFKNHSFSYCWNSINIQVEKQAKFGEVNAFWKKVKNLNFFQYRTNKKDG